MIIVSTNTSFCPRQSHLFQGPFEIFFSAGRLGSRLRYRRGLHNSQMLKRKYSSRNSHMFVVRLQRLFVECVDWIFSAIVATLFVAIVIFCQWSGSFRPILGDRQGRI